MFVIYIFCNGGNVLDRDYSQIFEIKHTKRFGWLIVITVVLFIALIFYTIYALFFKGSIFAKDITLNARSYFGVIMYISDSIEELNSKYDSAVGVGGSGYVWQGEDKSYLIALIYPEEDMATSVIASNNIENYHLEMVTFVTNNIEYDLPELSSDKITVVQSAINELMGLGEILYKLTISCQIGDVSTIACASTINNYKGVIEAKIHCIDNILANYSDDNISYLRDQLIKASGILEHMVNDLLLNDNVGNIMKYSYCEFIYLLCNY